jgi:hypothetical protein
MTMIIILLMEHEGARENDLRGHQQEGEGGKEKILSGVEDQNIVYVQRQHNETHQTLK